MGIVRQRESNGQRLVKAGFNPSGRNGPKVLAKCKMKNITIGGSLGSGKSSVGKMVAESLEYEFISTGSIFRRIASERNLDALETNVAAETDNSIDEEIDGFIQNRMTQQPLFVMDSRMAPHFVKDSFKVYLAVSPDEAASRVLADKIRQQEFYSSFEGAKSSLLDRRKFERDRYFAKYGFDIDDQSSYDVVIYTDGASPNQIAACLESAYVRKAASEVFVHRSMLVPMMSIRDLSGVDDEALGAVENSTNISAAFDAPYAYVFEQPLKLAACLRGQHDLIGIKQDPPSYIGKNPNLFGMAQELGLSHFYDWDEISKCSLKIVQMVSNQTRVVH